MAVPSRDPEELCTATDPAEHRECLVAGIALATDHWRVLPSLIGALPGDRSQAFVFMLHAGLPAGVDIAAELAGYTPMPVVTVQRAERLDPNQVYVVASGAILSAEARGIALVPDANPKHAAAPVDAFFRSLAEILGAQSVGVALAGMGAHGQLGLARIHAAGGLAVAQDPFDPALVGIEARIQASAGYLQTVARPGLLDAVWTLEEIPHRLAAYVDTHPHLPDEAAPGDENPVRWWAIKAIQAEVHAAANCDTTYYAPGYVVQRIGRRMRLLGLSKPDEYVPFLQRGEEAARLRDDLLPKQTRFFCFEPAILTVLGSQLLPQLFASRSEQNDLRVWIAGCATGEEAYSLAILLASHAERLPYPPRLQIFASDADEQALKIARKGEYPATIEADVPQWAMERYFERVNSGYKVRRELREQFVFARQNLLTDPPFSSVDLLACRQMLPLLDLPSRDKLANLFHFALRPEGCLLVDADSQFAADEIFEAVNPSCGLFRRRRVPSDALYAAVSVRQRRLVDWASEHVHRTNAHESAAIFKQLRGTQEQPAVLIDAAYNILYLSSHASRYLQPGAGRPVHNLLNQVSYPLRPVVVATVQAALVEQNIVTSDPVPAIVAGAPRRITLEVVPAVQEGRSDRALVIFHEDASAEPQPPPPMDPEQRIRLLESELLEVRHNLETTVEKYQTANEELANANEELRMLAEELSSALEELEVGNEMLASTNEELADTNQELRKRIEQTDQLTSDLTNLLLTGDIAMVFLDRHLALRWFTPQAKQVINLVDDDLGRPLSHITPAIDYPDLKEDVAQVYRSLTPRRREVRGGEQWYLVQIHPYHQADDRIDGIVVSFVDITSQKQAAEVIRQSEARLRMATEAGQVGIFDYDIDQGTATCSPIYYRITRAAQDRPITRDAMLDPIHPEDRTIVEQQISELLATGQSVSFEVRLQWPDSTVRWAEYSMIAIRDAHGAPQRITGTIRDITERKSAEAALREWNAMLERRVAERTRELERSNRELDQFAYIASHDLKAPLRAINRLVGWVRDDAAPVLPSTSRDHLDKLTSRVRRMEVLLDDLLTYSRAARQVHPQLKVDTAALVADVAELLAVPGVKVTVDGEMPVILTERVPLETVLRNLIGNAIKHHPHPEQGEVRVAAAEQGEWIEFSVADNGGGIAPDHHERIFQVFQRLNPQSDVEGSGMGLAVVKKIVESRGGRIAVESALGEGATFHFTWPRKQEQSAGR